MSTNGRQLPSIPGRGSVSFPGSQFPQTITLDVGAYFLLLQQVDVGSPSGITVTDNAGNVEYFNGHNAFGLMVGSYAQNPFVIALDTNNVGSGVDIVAINPANASEDQRVGGLGGKGQLGS